MPDDDQELELQRLRAVCHALTDALARRCLADVNARLEDPNDWPAGSEWDGLNGSSQATFRQIAWADAQLDTKEMCALLFDQYGSPKPYTGQD